MDVKVTALTDEQKSLVEGFINTKIEELMGEKNDMLVEYVMVMLSNGKDMRSVATDMEELIGGPESQSFAEWLGGCLRDNVLTGSKGENKGGAEPAAAAESKVDGQSPSRASADKPRARPSSRGVHVGEAKGEKRPSSARQAGGLLRTALAEAERSVATMPTTGRTQTVSITGLGAKAGGREGAAPGLVFNVKQGDAVQPWHQSEENDHAQGESPGKGKGGKGGKGFGKWFVPAPYWAGYPSGKGYSKWGSGKGKGKGKGMGSQTYIPPGSVYEKKDAEKKEAGVGGGGAETAATAAATPEAGKGKGGKGKGGKGKGKGKGGKGRGSSSTTAATWVREISKDEGLLTPR